MTTPGLPPTASPSPSTRALPPRPLLGPALAAVCALVTVIGTRQEWGHILVFSAQGVQDQRGFMTFVAALVLVGLSLARLALRLPDGPYFLLCAALGGAALALPLSYLFDVLTWGKVVILGNGLEVASASSGVYVSTAGAIAYLIALAWQYRQRGEGASF